jgi:hypothetical protein
MFQRGLTAGFPQQESHGWLGPKVPRLLISIVKKYKEEGLVVSQSLIEKKSEGIPRFEQQGKTIASS